MKSGFRQSMAWLHTWTGIVVSWLLYFIFITGTVGYFDTEIDAWMNPEMPVNTADAQSSLQTAQNHLAIHGKDATQWRVYLPVVRNEPHLWIAYQQKDEQGKLARVSKSLNGNTGDEIQYRETGGGQSLYRMHYRLHYLPTQFAYYLVGVFTLFMLLGLITGIVVHKKIFKEFFTFRRNKGATSWLDGHNLMSVVSLPFHLMITYSGLIMFMFTYVPFIINASYGFGEDSKQHFFDEYYKRGAPIQAAGQKASMQSLPEIYQAAEAVLAQHQDTRKITAIRIYHPYDSNALAAISLEQASPTDDGAKLLLHATNAELYAYTPNYQGVRQVQSVFLELHEGIFASLPIRWLYFISGLTGCIMIASGMVLWTTKRRKKALNNPTGIPFSFKLTEGLNIGTIVGLPAAIAVYFIANRLLPLQLPNRADWEMHCFFITLLLFFIHAMGYAWRNQSAIAWLWQWRIAGLLFISVPVINAITTSRGLLSSIQAQDWVYVSFDGLNLAIGLAMWLIAAQVKKRHIKHRSYLVTTNRQEVSV